MQLRVLQSVIYIAFACKGQVEIDSKNEMYLQIPTFLNLKSVLFMTEVQIIIKCGQQDYCESNSKFFK